MSALPKLEPASIQRRQLRLFDSQQLTQAVHEAELEHRQLEPGDFRGDLTSLRAGAVMLDSGCYSRTLHARGWLPEQTVVVGAILDAQRDGCLNGFRFGHRDLVCYPAGAELDYVLPADTRWLALQLPRAMLPRLGLSEDLFRRPQVFAASAPGPARITSRLQRLSQAGPAVSALGLMAEIDALASDLQQLPQGQAAPGRPSYAERMRQLRCFDQQVRECIGETPLIPALCDAIGVAQRTLEQTFRDHLGMSPRRYLTILRLHLAREALLHGKERNIAGVAARFGLRHPGRFSAEYRRFFGESPSATKRG